MDDMLFDPAADDLPDETSEYYRKLYEEERRLAEELAIEKDEASFRRRKPRRLTPALAKLARKTAEAAKERFEKAARTPEDFRSLVSVWDKSDRNRERREQYKEALRGDLPPEYGMAYEGGIVPRYYMDPAIRQLAQGYFLDILFDCPYEMHELTADAVLSEALLRLKEDHKEILYFLAIRLYSTRELGEMRGQTDRNIRKVRTTILKKLRKPLYAHLKNRTCLTKRERDFLALYEAIYAIKKTEVRDKDAV